jgi:hypothetical protein
LPTGQASLADLVRVEWGSSPIPSRVLYQEDGGMERHPLRFSASIKDQKLALLASVLPFSNCRRAQLTELGRMFDVVTLHPGDTVKGRWSRGTLTAVVASGTVVALLNGVPIVLLGQHQLWDEDSIARQGLPAVDLQAVEPTTLLVLDVQYRPLFAQRYPEFAAGFSGAAAIHAEVVEAHAGDPVLTR